ncbi:MAG TPA: hypothetical protein VJ779_21975, partial [Acetobacteraceae bacterium]|nr:hypothetical protein [Acetobacteraceae bacterium]
MSTGLVLGFGLVFAIGARAQQETTALSLKEVPIPKPTAAIIPCVRDKSSPNQCPEPKSAPDTIPIPGPETDLSFKDLKAAGIVKDEDALIRLGKALFWDMQVGSDGV